MRAAIVDTGALVAFMDRAERHHRWVAERCSRSFTRRGKQYDYHVWNAKWAAPRAATEIMRLTRAEARLPSRCNRKGG
jgi:predicted nucleic acid-binding protein